jgi:uncharacterized membrane-anchored protein
MTKLFRLLAIAAVSLPLAASAGKSHATPAPADPPEPAAPAADDAQPKIPFQPGPAKIPLGHELTLDLPAEHVYLDPKNAKVLLEKSGNFVGDNFLGIVLPKDDKQNWWVSVNYEDEGYIKDDEKIDGEEILKSMRDGLEDYNKERAEKGFPPLFIDGWSDPPKYDKGLHHLVWALELHSDKGKSVNYNTRILGRRGYVSLNLVTDPTTLTQDKPEVQKLLGRTTFDNGARYTDFDSKTDKVAAYGLAALIAGGAGVAALKVAKVGIFAKLLPLIAKGFKLIAAAFVALGLWIKRLFTGKDDRPPPPSMKSPPAGSSPPPPSAGNTPPDDHGSGGSSGTA